MRSIWTLRTRSGSVVLLRRLVQAGLAGDAVAEAALLRQVALAAADEAARVAERERLAAELLLERDLRAFDLVPALAVAERRQVRVGQGVRLEVQDSLAVEALDVVPVEQAGILGRPQVAGRAVDHLGGDEHGGREAELGQNGQRVLLDVLEAVVEGQRDLLGLELARVEQVESRHGVECAVALGGEVLHLRPELGRPQGERVGVVAHAVVQEHAQPALQVAPPHAPRDGADARQGRLRSAHDQHAVTSACSTDDLHSSETNRRFAGWR